MEFSFGPFHFKFGKNKKENEKNQEITPSNTDEKSTYYKITVADVLNVCEQVGAFEKLDLSDVKINQICSSIMYRLNSTSDSSSSSLASLFEEGFKENGVNISSRTAKLCAEAYIESYLTN